MCVNSMTCFKTVLFFYLPVLAAIIHASYSNEQFHSSQYSNIVNLHFTCIQHLMELYGCKLFCRMNMPAGVHVVPQITEAVELKSINSQLIGHNSLVINWLM